MCLIAIQYNSDRPIIHKRNIHHCCKNAVMNLFWNICSFQLVQELCIEVFGLQADMTGQRSAGSADVWQAKRDGQTCQPTWLPGMAV